MTAVVNQESDLAAPSNRRRVAPWIAGVVLVVLAAFLAVLALASPEDGAVSESALLGKPAPEAAGELGDGTVFDLARRKGSWVVLNFFRADCVPCIEEHPELFDSSNKNELQPATAPSSTQWSWTILGKTSRNSSMSAVATGP